VNIYELQVYKTVNRPRVNKSSKLDFIKMVLTKNQEKSQKNKEKVEVQKSKYIELNRTYYYTVKFNTALSLCEVLKTTLYFSKNFSKANIERSTATKVLQSLRVTITSCILTLSIPTYRNYLPLIHTLQSPLVQIKSVYSTLNVLNNSISWHLKITNNQHLAVTF